MKNQASTRIIISILFALVVGTSLFTKPSFSRLKLLSSIATSADTKPTKSLRQNGSSSSPPSPLNDQSLFYDVSVKREWLTSNYSLTSNHTATSAANRPPPAMLLLTDFGWNQVNQTEGKRVYRGVRTRQLVEGIINHPWFHPTAWRDILEGRFAIDPSIHYYVFLDQDTCMEKNWPGYNHGIGGMNRDRGEVQNYHIHRIDRVLFSGRTRIMELPNSRYILFECAGAGPKPCFRDNRQLSNNSSKLVWASLSSHVSQLMPQDFGLPPPAGKPCVLSNKERNEIENCHAEHKRTVRLSFLGNVHRKRARKELAKLNDPGSGVVIKKGAMGLDPVPLLKNSLFGAAPRGDNLFSYRFTEVLSCGAIPVVYADGWVLPFRLEEWEDAAVVIPESDASRSMEILRNFTPAERCKMRQAALRIYDKYMKDGDAVIRGIVDRLERDISILTNRTGPTS